MIEFEQLSVREQFALSFAAGEWGYGQWFEAYRLSSVEWAEVMTNGTEQEQRALRLKHNPAIGWGHTLRRMVEKGLIDRQSNGFTYNYTVTAHGVQVFESRSK